MGTTCSNEDKKNHSELFASKHRAHNTFSKALYSSERNTDIVHVREGAMKDRYENVRRKEITLANIGSALQELRKKKLNMISHLRIEDSYMKQLKQSKDRNLALPIKYSKSITKATL